MHCPSCGQQQISNETKFCSRCGMPLVIVSEVLMHGGYLPQLAQLEEKATTIYTRRNGVAFSLFWLIFWLLFMAVIFGGIFNVRFLGELFSVIGIFGGLLIFIFSLFFLKKAPKTAFPGMNMQGAQQGLYGAPNQQALPPQPAQSFAHPTAGSWRDTNDLDPRSKSEGATQMLTEEVGPHDTRRCPTCSTSYTDPTLRFCLVDGAPLSEPDQETVVRSTNDLSEPNVTRSREPGQ